MRFRAAFADRMYRLAFAAVTVFMTAHAWMREEWLFMAMGAVAAIMFCVLLIATLTMSMELTDQYLAVSWLFRKRQFPRDKLVRVDHVYDWPRNRLRVEFRDGSTVTLPVQLTKRAVAAIRNWLLR